MPAVVPTDEFLLNYGEGTYAIVRQSGGTTGAVYLDASIASTGPIGWVETRTGLRAKIGQPPAGAKYLEAWPSGVCAASYRAMINVFLLGGYAASYAALQMVIRTYDSAGNYIASKSGPERKIFDLRSAFFPYAEDDERYVSAQCSMSVDPNLEYELLLQTIQKVETFSGAPSAVSNCIYAFSLIEYEFS
jgi:hypothetical protein